jgi:uncharacterized protein (DUF952 family)
MGTLLHLAMRTDWLDALEDGAYRRSTRGAWVEDVGFVHASTSRQLTGVGDAFYGDVPVEDLVLLVIDEGALAQAGVPVRWDDVDGELFPHIGGAVPVEAVVATRDVSRAGDRLALPDLAGLDVVTGPPD